MCDMETSEQVKQIKRSFRLYMNGVTSTSMRQNGLDYKINWGVSQMDLRHMAEQYGKDKALAAALWQENIRECTQMVSKGLDFANVSMVGVVNADGLLHFPDFRANERAFNMLVQVAGRAGRRDEKGHVFIQTSDPTHPLLQFVRTQDYKAYYEYELGQRRQYGYPPFTKIITLYVRHRDEKVTEYLARKYTAELQKIFGPRVLGPAKPPIGRIANYYIQTIMLKMEAAASMTKVKQLLFQVFAEMAAEPLMKSAQVYYDVDPV